MDPPALRTNSIISLTFSFVSTLYANVIPLNPFPIAGGLIGLMSLANNSKGNNSNFVSGVLKKQTRGLFIF